MGRCPKRVICDPARNYCPPFDVCFGLKATRLLRAREMTRRANMRHQARYASHLIFVQSYLSWIVGHGAGAASPGRAQAVGDIGC